MKSAPFLSKSKYLNGMQCSKLLWYYYNAKKDIPPTDASTQAIFDQGHVVGDFAKRLFPGGVEVAPGIVDYGEAVKRTQEVIGNGVPLFEAAFLADGCYARADILVPAPKHQWDIIEVKSSTQVKEVNLHDLAVQWHTYTEAGLSIRSAMLMHINNSYVRKGGLDLRQLFTRADVTKQVKLLLPGVRGNIRSMLKVIGQAKAPEIPIGPHCNSPYECSLQQVCWKFLPKHNPTTLGGIRSKAAFELIDSGITDLRKLPTNVKLTGKQRIQVHSVITKKPHVDAKAIRAFMDTLVYPLYYLDFETFNPAVPLFNGTRPFQQIPFQFSLHIQKKPGGELLHMGYLHDGQDDPRPAFAAGLKESLGNAGSIVTYNASFERGRLKELVEFLPKYKGWNNTIQKRIVDLLDPFRAFDYYHPSQMGSASIKHVLPAMTGKGYEGMAIADGGVASQAFLRISFGIGIDDKDKKMERNNLERYCTQDTMGMVDIISRLTTF